jgi:predicted ester cyclase
VSDAKALVERMFEEIINQGRLDVADELFAEGFVDHGPMGDVHGRDAFKALVGAWRSAVPDVRCEISHVIEQGDTVAWLVHSTGTHTGDGLGFPATGGRFDTVSANIGRFENGRAVEHWSEQGMLSMLLQLGIVQPPVPA